MDPQEEELARKRRMVTFEMQGLAHTIKRYMNSLAEAQDLSMSGRNKGISGTNLFIIAYLYENREKDVFQKDLEEKMNVRRSTVSKVLQIMEGKDLIRREQVACDGRLKKIVLTPSALKGIENFKKDSLKVESRLTKGFTEEELDQFFYLLNKAKQNFQD